MSSNDAAPAPSQRDGEQRELHGSEHRGEKPALPDGYELVLRDIDDGDADICRKYRILDTLGQGGSSIVYKAGRDEQVRGRAGIRHVPHTYVIKEYYPSSLAGFIQRREDGSLDVALAAREKFEAGKDLFLNGYAIHADIEQMSPNQTMTPVDSLSGNNTEYIVMESAEGDPLDKCRSEIQTLTDAAEITISLARALRRYYRANERYLHLDIKPANIFKVRGENIVFIFDFDSIQKAADIENDRITFRSYSREWAAPEQRQAGRFRDISEATDIYSVGAVFFWLLAERKVDVNRDILFAGGKWPISGDNKFLRNVDPRCVGAVREILDMTLEPAPSCRCRNIDQLLDKLERLSDLGRKTEYLGETRWKGPARAFGCQAGIADIEARLKASRTLFLAESDPLCKDGSLAEYVERNPLRYKAVHWLRFSQSVMNTIASALPVGSWGMCGDVAAMSPEAVYGFKLRLLCEHGEDTLLVLDGYEPDGAAAPIQKEHGDNAKAGKPDRHLNDLTHGPGRFHIVVVRNSANGDL